MTFQITAFYAGIAGLLFLVLSARVILFRRAHRISLGDGGDPAMVARIRAQGNCAEYAPLGLLLLGFAEATLWPAFLVHLLGLGLIAGRAMHAVGLSSHPQKSGLRVAGMGLTLMMIGLTSGLLLMGAVF